MFWSLYVSCANMHDAVLFSEERVGFLFEPPFGIGVYGMLCKVLYELIIFDSFKYSFAVSHKTFVTHTEMLVAHKERGYAQLCAPQGHAAVTGKQDIGADAVKDIDKLKLLLVADVIVRHVAVILDCVFKGVGAFVLVVVFGVVVEDSCTLSFHAKFFEKGKEGVAVRCARGNIGSLSFQLFTESLYLRHILGFFAGEELLDFLFPADMLTEFSEPAVGLSDAVGGRIAYLGDTEGLFKCGTEVAPRVEHAWIVRAASLE